MSQRFKSQLSPLQRCWQQHHVCLGGAIQTAANTSPCNSSLLSQAEGFVKSFWSSHEHREYRGGKRTSQGNQCPGRNQSKELESGTTIERIKRGQASLVPHFPAGT